MLIDYPFDYWKLLGDGIMLVWESKKDESMAVDSAIDAAYELHKKYWYYRKETNRIKHKYFNSDWDTFISKIEK